MSERAPTAPLRAVPRLARLLRSGGHDANPQPDHEMGRGSIRAFSLAMAVLAVAAGALIGQEKEVIQLPSAPEGLPFSTAVRVGEMIFLSGQIGNEPGTTTLVAGGIAAETRQTLENIRATLVEIGSSLDRVVKCTVFLRDFADYATMNDVYREFFPKDPPARSTVAGSGLALNARVEIDCIALAGRGR